MPQPNNFLSRFRFLKSTKSFVFDRRFKAFHCVEFSVHETVEEGLVRKRKLMHCGCRFEFCIFLWNINEPKAFKLSFLRRAFESFHY